MEEIKVSERFNASDADVILISSDNIQFKVHESHLTKSSCIFKEMLKGIVFDIIIPKIELNEAAGVLEIVLPYFYPITEVDTFDLKSIHALGAMRACIKYRIFYAVKSIELALVYSNLEAYEEIFFGYTFAVNTSNNRLRLRMFNGFNNLSPELGNIENVSDSAVQILYPLEVVQFQQEWAIRIHQVSGLYRDLTDFFFF